MSWSIGVEAEIFVAFQQLSAPQPFEAAYAIERKRLRPAFETMERPTRDDAELIRDAFHRAALWHRAIPIDQPCPKRAKRAQRYVPWNLLSLARRETHRRCRNRARLHWRDVERKLANELKARGRELFRDEAIALAHEYHRRGLPLPMALAYAGAYE